MLPVYILGVFVGNNVVPANETPDRDFWSIYIYYIKKWVVFTELRSSLYMPPQKIKIIVIQN